MAHVAKIAAWRWPRAESRTRRVNWVLVTLVTVALVVRIALVLATPHWHPANPYVDAGEYDRDAVALVSGQGFGVSDATFHGGPTAYHPPLFSIALAGVYEVSGTSNTAHRWKAGRAFEAVLGAVAVGLIWLIALELFGATVALIAGALAAVYPPLVLVGSSLMSESLFVPLALGAVYAGLRARSGAGGDGVWRWQVAAGALGGMSALTRESGLVLLVGLCWLAWPAAARPGRFMWAAIKAPAIVLATAVLVLTPWAIRNQTTFHKFEPLTTGAGYALAGAYDHEAQASQRFPAMWQAPFADIAAALKLHPHASEAQISGSLITMSLHYIEHHPVSLLKTAYWSTLRLLNLTGPWFEDWFAPYEGYPIWLAAASVWAFYAVALMGLAALAWRPARRAAGRAPAAFWACPILMFLSCVPFAGSTRYRSPADPFLVTFVAVLLGVVFDRRRGESVASA
jgi:4-amino-4-deoxy-L-arabinose transferase-like glycosyltransferase